MLDKIRLPALVLTVITATGCANTDIFRDPRDAPWDPKPGQGQLFEQIPAWDNAAEKICCGHLRECKPHQSPRC
jgi:hypothetical protein